MQASCKDNDEVTIVTNQIFLAEGKSCLFPEEIPPLMTVLEHLALILFRNLFIMQYMQYLEQEALLVHELLLNCNLELLLWLSRLRTGHRSSCLGAVVNESD